MKYDIYLDCLDDNGERINRTIKGWNEYHKARGTEKGNKPSSIYHRYIVRKENGYTMRDVCGLNKAEVKQPIRSKKREYTPDNSIMGRFFRSKLA